MGKRKSNVITGLSRFLAEATKPDTSPEPETFPSPGSSSQPGLDPPQVLQDAHKTGADDSRPNKKPKIRAGLLGEGLEKYDATGLVPFYTEAHEVPEHLQKYFSQRERFFSMYSSGCLLDEEGWYSVTPERVADQIAERCRCEVILDAFCGVGGNAIAFARTCERVIALDISPVRLALARHNAAIYGVQDRIEFVLADFLSFARALQTLPRSENGDGQPHRRKIDVVFLSPPWGGPSYISGSPTKAKAVPEPEVASEDAHAEFSLESIRPIHGRDLFKVARGITKNVAYFLPRNTSIEEVSQLVTEDSGEGADQNGPRVGAEKIEVEEEWMGSKLKALTCYFGGLVAGQEEMFDV
ncbi:S-adenosyl-L-methionine-dependent methyltransferase [Cubamyces sp. BRFM 1775]|nr:S-adenosyl-L-methionine-dependent methyltransferase [Cubamyces sp. BRFM 1775]